MPNSLRSIPTDRAEWLRMRQGYVGASEVAALFGLQAPYQLGLFALWHVKAGKVPPPEIEGERLRWGLWLEDGIAEGCRQEKGWDVRPGQYATHPCGLGATLDRIIAAAPEMDGPGVLEMKNVDFVVHRRSWKAEPPLHIQLQLQAQLLATGFRWGAVAALVGGNRLETHIERPRPNLQTQIAARVGEFWRRVREDDPPAPDGSDSAFRTLVALQPELDREPADLTDDAEAARLAEEMVEAAEARKAADARLGEARNLLLAKFGPHAWAKVPGFRASVRVTPDNPGRAAVAGEIVGARKGSRSLHVERMDQ